jgi:hypothetical protein
MKQNKNPTTTTKNQTDSDTGAVGILSLQMFYIHVINTKSPTSKFSRILHGILEPQKFYFKNQTSYGSYFCLPEEVQSTLYHSPVLLPIGQPPKVNFSPCNLLPLWAPMVTQSD